MDLTVTGVIVCGKRMGRLLGFPTANLEPSDPGAPLPENGVYIGQIRLEGANEPWRICVVNHGMQPTLPSGRRTIEAHILDFDHDVYGLRAQLRFLRYLRPEQKFDTGEQLRAQLERDVQAARAFAQARAAQTI